MKFLVNFVVSEGKNALPDDLASIAVAIEASGLDAIGFTDHPAPSGKWLEAGGHATLDPFAAMSFVAGLTKQLTVVANLLVAPYRNPLLQATSIASVDLLAGGRSAFVLGAGYLRSEFAALGVDFAERNELFDEAVDVMRRYLSGDDLSYAGRHFVAAEQRRRPLPAHRPHPPLWVGGNSDRALERAARWGAGWSALVGPARIARSARTRPIASHDDLRRAVERLADRALAQGRSVADIAVCVGSPLIGPGSPAGAAQQFDEVSRLSEIGADWISVELRTSEPERALDELHAFATAVSSRAVDPI